MKTADLHNDNRMNAVQCFGVAVLVCVDSIQ